jgi:hypothetical protein
VRSAEGKKLDALAPGAPQPLATGSNRYLLTIAARKDAPITRQFTYVTLTTDHAKAEKVAIRALLNVVGPIEVVPPQITMRPSKEPPVATLRVSRPAGTPLRIRGVESSDPDFSTEVAPVRKGREYAVHVRYTGKPGRGVVRARLTIKTNEPAQATIGVPVVGTF